MKWVSYPLLVWLAVLYAVGWSEVFSVGGARLDALALLAVWLGLKADKQTAGPAGWGVGLAQDTFSLSPLGTHAFVYFAVSTFLAERRRALAAEHPLGMFAAAAGTVFAVHSVEGVLLSRAAGEWATAVGRALSAALFAGLAAPVLFAILSTLPTGWTAKPDRF